MKRVAYSLGVAALLVLNVSCASVGRLRTGSGGVPAKIVRLRGQDADAVKEWHSSHEGEQLDLWLDEMVSLPGSVIIVSGEYYAPASTMHPAFLISHDGGRSWQEPGWVHRFGGSGIGHLQTFGESHIWGLVVYLVEGLHYPSDMIRSTDGGKTWGVVGLQYEQLNPLEWASEFRFYDEQHGLLTIDGSIGKLRTYTTTDGGATWKELWSVTTDARSADWSYRYPGTAPELPMNAPLWRKESDMFLVAGAVRARHKDGEYLVEVRGGEEKTWTMLSRIPTEYVIRKGRLVPRADE